MDRATAAALDRYLTSSPYDEPIYGVDFWYHCSNACGAFLKAEPDSVGYESRLYPCPGMPNEYGYDSECDKWREPVHDKHWFVDHAVTLAFRFCSRCGYKNTEVIW
jgi:hypothetical protein